jgi:hypothetical protein
MADQQTDSQYGLIYTLGVTPGIKRDGTKFDSREYTDGVWCRFQRGLPVKMGGYLEMFGSFNGIERGMIANAYNGVNYVYAGNKKTLDIFTTGQSLGVGSGPYEANMLPGYAQLPVAGDTITNTATSFAITSTNATPVNYTTAYPSGTKIIFSQSANPTIYTVASSSFATPVTTVNFTPPLPVGFTVTNVWLANTFYQPDDRNLWQFDFQYNPLGGALDLLAHPGLNLNNINNAVPTQVYYGDSIPGVGFQWTMQGLADTTGQNPTYKPISVDGGVCMLYPFIFVYGSSGFIANNNVDNTLQSPTLTDWNGPLANQVNVAAGKIVKGIPIRGGTNAPSGLFWATDSLIRVSFSNNPPTYWSYDIVSSQCSIMSSNAVCEMDGLYYWMGIDRFYVYNGQVKVLPNDKNINWLFDNINYLQRQKVWATKVPRYNEIWFFYPRGTATECTDAIIYNVKDNLWYDAGQAVGARRSCGYTTETFPYPIWAGWEYDPVFGTPTKIIATPVGQPAPTIYQIYASGDVTSQFAPGNYLSLSNQANAKTYKIVTSQFIFNLTVPMPGVTLITVEDGISPSPIIGNPFYSAIGGYPIWQQEFGYNVVSLNDVNAIYSSFLTCDLSWIGGTPANDSPQGINRRMHIRRVEPDFVQTGDMQLTILGRKFAKSPYQTSGPYIFSPDTEKIDLRVEYREVSLLFESNVINGNYQLGRTMLTVEYGDERP